MSVQAVIGADYFFQTRDAGLTWGELSAADYAHIIRQRFARAHGAGADFAQNNTVMTVPARALPRPAAPEEAQAQICVRRGTELACQ